MKDTTVKSPMPWGNGAYVVSRILERQLKNYAVAPYHPLWTLLPFLIPFVCRTGGAQVIHTTPDYGIFSYNKTAPLVLTFHNYVLDPWMRSYSSPAQRVHYATALKLFTRLSIRKADAITAVSRFLAAKVEKELSLPAPVRVIYNGVDTAVFTPAADTAAPKAGGKIRALFSGNLTLRKGAQWLPSIADKLHKNIEIVYTRGLRTRDRLAPKNNLAAVGSVPFNKMPRLYRDMDILLLPSVREGFGLAVAEAMACGLPVVASDCSAIPELVHHGRGGYLCPVGDVDAFAQSINMLAGSPRLRRDMGAYNRARIEACFSLDKMVDGYRRLFEEHRSTKK